MCGLAWQVPANATQLNSAGHAGGSAATCFQLVHASEAAAQPCATVQENGTGLLGGEGRPSAANGGSELAAASGLSPDAVLGREGGNPKHPAAPPVGPGQIGSSPQVRETCW